MATMNKKLVGAIPSSFARRITIKAIVQRMPRPRTIKCVKKSTYRIPQYMRYCIQITYDKLLRVPMSTLSLSELL